MIKLNPAPTFTTDVRLTVPGQEKPVTASFTFKYMTADESIAFWKDRGDKKIKDCLHELIEDWSGFDAPYSPENLAVLSDHYAAAPGEILEQYQKALFGSRIKN